MVLQPVPQLDHLAGAAPIQQGGRTQQQNAVPGRTAQAVRQQVCGLPQQLFVPQGGKQGCFQTDQAAQPVALAGFPAGLPQAVQNQVFLGDFPFHQLAQNAGLDGLQRAGGGIFPFLQFHRKGLSQGGPGFQPGFIRFLCGPQKQIARHLAMDGQDTENLPHSTGGIVDGKSLPGLLQPLEDPLVLHFLHNLRPHNPTLGGLDHKDPIVLMGRRGHHQGIGCITDCKRLL